jgi:cbb3-type cytochrome oxidase maturation protein
MSGLLVLIPIAIVMGLAALAAFLWALRSGQYEDLEGAGQRILGDDRLPPKGRPDGKA